MELGMHLYFTLSKVQSEKRERRKAVNKLRGEGESKCIKNIFVKSSDYKL